MYLKFFLLVILFSFRTSYGVTIVGDRKISVEEATRLQLIGIEAQQKFEKLVAPLSQEVTIKIDPKNCLRTGYNYVNHAVNFCSIDGIKSRGILSDDVIIHELFHAFLCSVREDLCQRKMNVETISIHEGLADWFTYLLRPDLYFGESFYLDTPYVRKYNNGLCYSLVPGGHGKGNALTSSLIKLPEHKLKRIVFLNQFSINGMIASGLLSGDCYRKDGPLMKVSPVKGSASKLNRYKVPKSDKREFAIETNALFKKIFPNHSINFVGSDGESLKRFKFSLDKDRFSVQASVDRGFEKALLVILNNQSIQVGVIPMYFSIEK